MKIKLIIFSRFRKLSTSFITPPTILSLKKMFKNPSVSEMSVNYVNSSQKNDCSQISASKKYKEKNPFEKG
jgi:hypothetical protein